MSQHSQRAGPALRRLAEEDPAFAALSLWVHHRDADGPIAANDGVTIWYGPGFEDLTAAEQVGIAAHQLTHVAFRHAARSRAQAQRTVGFDPDVFSLAADAVVNSLLLLAGYVVPRPCAEIVPLVRGALGTKTSPSAAITQWDVERLYAALIEAGGAPGYAAEVQHQTDLVTDGVETQSAAAEAEAAAEWRQRLARALTEGRHAGRGIGALTLRIGDLPRSTVPWERHLRHVVAQALATAPGLSWARPRGRWLAAEAMARADGRPVPVYEPGRRRDQPDPTLAVAVDCSSSVSSEMLRRFGSEVAGIGRRTGADLHLILFDEAVQAVRRLRGAWEAELASSLFARDGGTDFGPMFDTVRSLAPDAAIILTDLEAPVPDGQRCPVIWAVPDHGPVPPFGTRVVLRD